MLRTGVIGLGLIGGSIARRLIELGQTPLGWDRSSSTRERAARLGVEICEPEEMAREIRLAVVCTPVAETAAEVRRLLGAGAPVVTDVGSVKATLIRELCSGGEALSPAQLKRFIAGHPMAGSHGRGLRSSSADLLRGCNWAVSGPNPSVESLLTLSELTGAFDARMIVCGARRHDAAVARSSHVIQLLHTALAGSLLDGDPLSLALSGPALRDTTRLAASPWGVWKEILSENKTEARAALAELRCALAEIATDDSWESGWRRGLAGRSQLSLTRWREPEWRPGAVPRDGFWSELLELGERGVPIRRLRADERLVYLERG